MAAINPRTASSDVKSRSNSFYVRLRDDYDVALTTAQEVLTTFGSGSPEYILHQLASKFPTPGIQAKRFALDDYVHERYNIGFPKAMSKLYVSEPNALLVIYKHFLAALHDDVAFGHFISWAAEQARYAHALPSPKEYTPKYLRRPNVGKKRVYSLSTPTPKAIVDEDYALSAFNGIGWQYVPTRSKKIPTVERTEDSHMAATIAMLTRKRPKMVFAVRDQSGDDPPKKKGAKKKKERAIVVVEENDKKFVLRGNAEFERREARRAAADKDVYVSPEVLDRPNGNAQRFKRTIYKAKHQTVQVDPEQAKLNRQERRKKLQDAKFRKNFGRFAITDQVFSMEHSVNGKTMDWVSHVLKELFAHVNSVTEGVSDKVRDATGGVSAVIKDNAKLLGFIKWSLITCLFAITVKKAGAVVMDVFKTVFMLLVPEDVKDVIESVTDDICDQSGVTIPFDSEYLVRIVSALGFATLFPPGTVQSVRNLDFSAFMRNFGRAAHNARHSESDIENLIGLTVNIINGFLEFACLALRTDRVRIETATSKALSEYFLAVEREHADFTTGLYGTSRVGWTVSDRLYYAVDLRKESVRLLDVYKGSSEAQRILIGCQRKLDVILNRHKHSINPNRGQRVEPVNIMLSGLPGVGKSTMSTYFATAVLKAVYPSYKQAKDHALIYSKDTGEYWEGYNDQPILSIDDFLATVPNPNKDNEASMMLRTIGCSPLPLPMANVEAKGEVFFQSKIVISTTNCTALQDASKVLLHLDALKRRLHHPYEVRLNPAAPSFHKVNPNHLLDRDSPPFFLDPVAVRRYVEERKQYPWHAWQMVRLQYDTTSVRRVGEWISPVDAMREVVESLKLKKMIHESNNLHDIIDTDFDDPNLGRDLDEQPVILTDQGLGFVKIASFLGKGIYKALPRRRTTRGGLVARVDLVDSEGTPILKNCTLTAGFNEVATDQESLLLERDTLISTIRNIAGVLGIVLIGGFFVSVITKLVKKCIAFFSKKQSAPTDDVRWRIKSMMKDLNKDQLINVHKHVASLKAQDQSNEEYSAVVRNKPVDDAVSAMRRNMISIVGVRGAHTSQFGFGLGLGGKHYLLPAHIDKAIETEIRDGDRITITHHLEKTRSVSITGSEWKALPRARDVDGDLSVVSITSMLCPQRDIVKFILTEADTQRMAGQPVYLDVPDVSGGFSKYHNPRVERTSQVSVKSDHRKVIRETYCSIGMPTSAGDCGSVLRSAKHFGPRFICGLHSAGSSIAFSGAGIAYSTVVTCEIVKKLLAQLEATDPSSGFITSTDQAGTIEENPGFPCEPDKTFSYVRTVDRSMSISQPIKSTWVPTGFGQYAKLWKVEGLAPALLRPTVGSGGVRINPMRNALSNYGAPLVHLPQAKVTEAVYTAFKPMRDLNADVVFRAYTFEEAVAGIIGKKYCKGIPRKTSAGYPLNLTYKRGKKMFFGDDGEYVFDNEHVESLRAEVMDILQDAKVGIRREHIFSDFLKDEVVSASKAAAGNTRLISSAPLAYLIAFRMLFLDFCVQVQVNHIYNGVAVGINVFSEWGELVRHLTGYSTQGFAGDFKKFDANQLPQILCAIGDNIGSFYKDEWSQARRVLWAEVYNSRHIGGPGGSPNTIIYDWCKSLPSGHPCTSIVNSFYNISLFVLCYGDLTSHSMSTFWSNVRLGVFGDDNVVFPSFDISHVYHQNSMPEAMSAYNMTYTSEQKDDTSVPDLRPITDMSFLKRGFRACSDKHDGSYDCPLELASLIKVPSFVPDKNREREIQSQNVDTCLRELALHGPEVFNEYQPELLSVMLKAYGISPANDPSYSNSLRLARESENPW